MTDRRSSIGDFVGDYDVVGDSSRRAQHEQATDAEDDAPWNAHGLEPLLAILD